MKKFPALLATLTAILFSFSFVYAQTSISGDSLCGSSAATACNLDHLKSMVKGVMYLVLGIGLPLLVVVIAYRFVMAWFAALNGQTGAYKDAIKKAGQSILGFIILVALFGGVLTVVLKYLGATDPVLKVLDLISKGFFETAYAEQDVPLLPSPVEDTNLYDFMLTIISLVMRFFIYPALIVIWVATGFSFVLAQGKPEALSKAKKLIIWATVSTFVIVMIQAFLFAAKGTVEQILPGSTGAQSAQTQSQTRTPTATDISNCTSRGGVLSSDGTCMSGASRAGTAATDFCNGKPSGTLCTLTSGSGSTQGICKRDTVFGCFAPTQGEWCISPNGKIGVIDSSLNCFVRSSGVESGGSCRIGAECLSNICYSSVCYDLGESCTLSSGRYGRITTNRTCQ